MSLNGITEKFIVVSINGEEEKPVYVYEFSANDSGNLENATKYEDQATAVGAADLLNQMQAVQGGTKTFEARKLTTIVEGVE